MQNVTHLVCQHVEGLSWDILETYPQVIDKVIGRWPGIYVLYHKGKPYYVGLATKLIERFPGHLNDKNAGKWETFSLYLTLGEKFIKDLEALLLHIYKPSGNSNRMQFKHSENLASSIDKMVKAAQKNQREALWGRSVGGSKNMRLTKVGRKSTLAPFISKRIDIRMIFKGKRYIAHVRPDGLIAFDHRSADYSRVKGKVFTSPSSAASAVAGHAMDGWSWWQFEHGKGHWVPLDKLRNS